MSKYEGHTPGDWWAEGVWIAAQVPGGRPNGEIIGRMEPSIPRYREAGEANAKLAADAPKLARENEELRDLLESHGPEGHNVTNEQHVKLREHRNKAIEMLKALSGGSPICDFCGATATCLGAYESDENLGFACDTCCGHGNEDGWCVRIGVNASHAENRRLRKALREIGHDCMVSTSEAEVLDEIASVVDAALAATEPEVCRCRWSEDEAAWVHDCGMRWYLLNDPPTKAIGANYCPKCGLKLEVVNDE